MDITKVKELLQTYCKQNHYKSPKYKTIFILNNEDDYKKLYTISVEIKGVLTAAESGLSRRIAEKKAAIKALVELKILNEEQVERLNQENENGNAQGKNNENNNLDNGKGKDKIVLKPPETMLNGKNIESDKNVVNKNKTFGIANPKTSSINIRSNQNDIKFIDDNPNYNQKHKNKSLNSPKANPLPVPQPQNQPKANQKIFNIYDFDENSICALIKYCLRNQIPLPFYDFNFNEGLFCTQCKVETDNREFIGYGKSSTLRSAKMIASQEVVDQLKKFGLYYVDSRPRNNSDTKILSSSFAEKFENGFKEYSSLTINTKTTNKKIKEDKSKTLPIKQNIDDFDDDFTDKNYSTSGSRDDNNNPNGSNFNAISKEEWKKYHDYNIIIDNPVSYLHDFCSKNKIKAPKYEQQPRSRKDRCPFFTYKCWVNSNGKQIIGIGLADSKKSAKKAAAEEVIKKLLKL